MKKIIILLIAILTISYSTIHVHALNTDSPISDYGITEEGIGYQVYGTILSITANNVTLQKTFFYNGNVTPALSISWTETIDGINYTGTLYLVTMSYNKNTNTTTATYQGTLYKTSRISSH